MIPEFPKFKHLSIGDRSEIESYVRQFPPYSDFNFTSLICYDTCGTFELSFLHGNLVVKMLDYMTAKPFYTFLGQSAVADTLTKLLDRSIADGINPVLRLVPLCNFEQAQAGEFKHFALLEDADGFDYLYCAKTSSNLAGPDFYNKRHQIKTFKRSYPNHIVAPLDLHDARTREMIVNLLAVWQEQHRHADDDVAIEFAAIRRCLEHVRHLSVTSIGVTIEEALVGFIMTEVIPNGYMMGHFLKADQSYTYAGDLLMAEMCGNSYQQGVGIVNCQQDLGLRGLRFWKESWRPVRLLKKVLVRRTEVS